MTDRPATPRPPRGPTTVGMRQLAAAAALVLAALVATLTAGAGAAAAQTEAGSPGATAATGATGQPVPVVQLVSQPAWVHPGDRYDASVRVTSAPAGAALDMVVHDRLQTRAELRAILDAGADDGAGTAAGDSGTDDEVPDASADDLGGTLVEVGPQPLSALPKDTAGRVTIGFDPGPSGPGGSGRGVYPVEIRLRSAGETVASTLTFLSFLNEPPGPPLEVGIIVDAGAEPTLRPDGSEVVPTGASDRVRERATLLRDLADLPLTLAPLPETIAGLAGAGDEEQAVLSELAQAASGSPVLSRPFVDVDIAALQRAGLLTELDAHDRTGAEVVRTQLDVEPTGGVWLPGPTVGAEAAATAREIGYARAVVPSSALAADGDEFPTAPAAPVRLGEGGPLAMVSDDALAGHLAGSEVVAAHRFLAELTALWLEAPSTPRAVVVRVPADADLEPAVTSTALGALRDTQVARVAPVDRILGQVPQLEEGPTTVDLVARGEVADLRALAPRIRNARGRVAGVGEVLRDPAASTTLEHALLLATGADTRDDVRDDYVDQAESSLDWVAGGTVTVPDEFRITLTSRSSILPVTVTNHTDQELSVRVELDSDQLEFPDGAVLDADLEPGTNRFEVPVRTRTSGAFTVDVTVTSPDGSIELDSSTFDVRSTAISGVGLVLSVGAGLFLAVWWARHWRNARRSRHLVPAGSSPTGDGSDPRAPAGTAAPPGPGGVPAGHAASGAGDGDAYRPAHMARSRSRSG